MATDAQYILRTYARQPVEIVRGEGVFLWDAAGKRYMDFHSGIAVNSLGHAHPAWVAAVQQQATQLCHVSNLFYTAPQATLAKQLIDMTGGAFQKVFFCNSGTEANEAALKFTRKYQLVQARKRAEAADAAAAKKAQDAQAARADQTEAAQEKTGMVAFQGGFHGRSMGSLSLTSKWAYRGPFAPLLSDVAFLPFNDVAALDQSITARTAGAFVEPVQGEGGVHPAKPEFLARLRELTRQHDALLIVDEVQAGLSRLGSPVAHQHAALRRGANGHELPAIDADMMTLAKPLAGGLPIGAVLLKQAVADCLTPGDHGSTFSGGPLVCAAAQVVVRELTSEQVLRNVNARSEQLLGGLRSLARQLESAGSSVRITDVRGLGLLVGVELSCPVAPVVAAAGERGLMLISAGENVLRLCPPLVIKEDEVDFALQQIADAIKQVASATPKA